MGLLRLGDGAEGWVIEWVDDIDPSNAVPPVETTAPQLVALARDAELRLYAARPGVVLPDSETFHYEGPSGAHYRSYFRGALAFLSRDSVDALAFWIAHLLPPRCVLILDTPLLLGVGLGVVEYLRRELKVPDDDLPAVEARESYIEKPSTLAYRLENVPGAPHRPVVVLSSIASSGRTVEALATACAGAGYQDVRQLALFAGEGSLADLEALQQIDLDISRSSAGNCDDCLSAQKPIVKIRPETNLVEVSALVSEARITFGAAAEARGFFERHGSLTSALTVHRNQHDGRRHHVVDIDAEVLCRADSFRARAFEALRGLEERKLVIVHPVHRGAAAVARLAQERLGCAVVPCDPQNVGRNEELRDACRDVDHLLVVDDVSITGSRLRQYRTWLNASHIVSADGQPTVGAFVGVLRPSSPGRRQAVFDMVDDPSYLRFVEELRLPDWQERECPWCFEQDLLESHADVAVSDLMTARRELLLGGGLTNQLYLPWAQPTSQLPLLDPQEPHEAELVRLLESGASDEELREHFADGSGAEALELGPRSIFGNLETEAQVFVAVASSLQVLRGWEHGNREQQKNSLSETFTSPIARVLAPEFYLSGRFFAPVILGAFLRGARRFDLRAAAIETRMRKAAGERFADHPIARPEMLYAMNRGVLPRPTEAGDASLLEGCDPSVLRFLEATQPV